MQHEDEGIFVFMDDDDDDTIPCLHCHAVDGILKTSFDGLIKRSLIMFRIIPSVLGFYKFNLM